MYLSSPPDRESLKEAIYALRASGITLKEIALRAEIDQSTLYNFMNGRTRRLANLAAEKLRAFVERKLVEEVHPTLLESLQARAMKKGVPGSAAYFKPLVRPTTDLIRRYAGVTCGLHTADDRGEPTFSAFLHISKSIAGNTAPIAVKRPRKGNSELSYDGALVDLGTMLLAIASDESNRLFLAILESVLRTTTAIMLLGYEVQTNSNAELIIKKCVGLRLNQEADADYIDDSTIAKLKELLNQH